MRVSLVATGIENNVISLKEKNKKRSKDEIFERMNSKIKDEDDNLERKKQSKPNIILPILCYLPLKR